MEIAWADGRVDLRCPVCTRTKSQRLIARVPVEWQSPQVEIARCADCNAVVLGAQLPPSWYTDADWDIYVEQIAGIEAIADMLVQSGMRRGARMLDVGCGYGFALDVARFLFDAEGIGLDPSVAAERGRRELDLDIRPGTLDDAFPVDEHFDVIFSSEVIEHVADPHEYLAAMRLRLSPDGIVVLTTPDASVVEPDTPWTLLYPVLSVGLHEFLVDASGLERLLTDAGFAAKVWPVGPSLHAVASLDPAALNKVRPDERAALGDLIRYCETRAARAEPGSALALGMAMRQLKWMVRDGDFGRVADCLPLLRDAVQRRHSIDIDAPLSVVGDPEVAAVMTGIFHNLGAVHLWHERRPKPAAACFTAAAWCGRAQWDRYGHYADPETPIYEALARTELAVVMVQTAPKRVDAELDALDEAVARGAGTDALAAEAHRRVDAERRMYGSRARRAYRRARRAAGKVKRKLRRLRS